MSTITTTSNFKTYWSTNCFESRGIFFSSSIHLLELFQTFYDGCERRNPLLQSSPPPPPSSNSVVQLNRLFLLTLFDNNNADDYTDEKVLNKYYNNKDSNNFELSTISSRRYSTTSNKDNDESSHYPSLHSPTNPYSGNNSFFQQSQQQQQQSTISQQPRESRRLSGSTQYTAHPLVPSTISTSTYTTTITTTAQPLAAINNSRTPTFRPTGNPNLPNTTITTTCGTQNQQRSKNHKSSIHPSEKIIFPHGYPEAEFYTCMRTFFDIPTAETVHHIHHIHQQQLQLQQQHQHQQQIQHHFNQQQQQQQQALQHPQQNNGHSNNSEGSSNGTLVNNVSSLGALPIRMSMTTTRPRKASGSNWFQLSFSSKTNINNGLNINTNNDNSHLKQPITPTGNTRQHTFTFGTPNTTSHRLNTQNYQNGNNNQTPSFGPSQLQNNPSLPSSPNPGSAMVTPLFGPTNLSRLTNTGLPMASFALTTDVTAMSMNNNNNNNNNTNHKLTSIPTGVATGGGVVVKTDSNLSSYTNQNNQQTATISINNNNRNNTNITNSNIKCTAPLDLTFQPVPLHDLMILEHGGLGAYENMQNYHQGIGCITTTTNAIHNPHNLYLSTTSGPTQSVYSQNHHQQQQNINNFPFNMPTLGRFAAFSSFLDRLIISYPQELNNLETKRYVTATPNPISARQERIFLFDEEYLTNTRYHHPELIKDNRKYFLNFIGKLPFNNKIGCKNYPAPAFSHHTYIPSPFNTQQAFIVTNVSKDRYRLLFNLFYGNQNYPNNLRTNNGNTITTNTIVTALSPRTPTGGNNNNHINTINNSSNINSSNTYRTVLTPTSGVSIQSPLHHTNTIIAGSGHISDYYNVDTISTIMYFYHLSQHIKDDVVNRKDCPNSHCVDTALRRLQLSGFNFSNGTFGTTGIGLANNNHNNNNNYGNSSSSSSSSNNNIHFTGTSLNTGHHKQRLVDAIIYTFQQSTLYNMNQIVQQLNQRKYSEFVDLLTLLPQPLLPQYQRYIESGIKFIYPGQINNNNTNNNTKNAQSIIENNPLFMLKDCRNELLNHFLHSNIHFFIWDATNVDEYNMMLYMVSQFYAEIQYKIKQAQTIMLLLSDSGRSSSSSSSKDNGGSSSSSSSTKHYKEKENNKNKDANTISPSQHYKQSNSTNITTTTSGGGISSNSGDSGSSGSSGNNNNNQNFQTNLPSPRQQSQPQLQPQPPAINIDKTKDKSKNYHKDQFALYDNLFATYSEAPIIIVFELYHQDLNTPIALEHTPEPSQSDMVGYYDPYVNPDILNINNNNNNQEEEEQQQQEYEYQEYQEEYQEEEEEQQQQFNSHTTHYQDDIITNPTASITRSTLTTSRNNTTNDLQHTSINSSSTYNNSNNDNNNKIVMLNKSVQDGNNKNNQHQYHHQQQQSQHQQHSQHSQQQSHTQTDSNMIIHLEEDQEGYDDEYYDINEEEEDQYDNLTPIQHVSLHQQHQSIIPIQGIVIGDDVEQQQQQQEEEEQEDSLDDDLTYYGDELPKHFIPPSYLSGQNNNTNNTTITNNNNNTHIDLQSQRSSQQQYCPVSSQISGAMPSSPRNQSQPRSQSQYHQQHTSQKDSNNQQQQHHSSMDNNTNSSNTHKTNSTITNTTNNNNNNDNNNNHGNVVLSVGGTIHPPTATTTLRSSHLTPQKQLKQRQYNNNNNHHHQTTNNNSRDLRLTTQTTPIINPTQHNDIQPTNGLPPATMPTLLRHLDNNNQTTTTTTTTTTIKSTTNTPNKNNNNNNLYARINQTHHNRNYQPPPRQPPRRNASSQPSESLQRIQALNVEWEQTSRLLGVDVVHVTINKAHYQQLKTTGEIDESLLHYKLYSEFYSIFYKYLTHFAYRVVQSSKYPFGENPPPYFKPKEDSKCSIM